MRRIVFAIGILVATAEVNTAASIAQNPPQGPTSKPAPQTAGGMPQQGLPQAIDLATAKKMVAAAEAAAAVGNRTVAICVMDTNGDVVLAERMDGANHDPVITAQGKARAVLVFGIATSEIAQAMKEKKPIPAPVRALPNGYGGEFTLGRGGMPIMRDGKMIGAIGIGGSSDDDKLCKAGIDAISMK